MNTLLLTWTIHPDLWNNHDYRSWSLLPDIRWKDYLKTLIFYITLSNFDNIVFCENSFYDIWDDLDLLNTLSKDYGKCFEFLQFIWDNEKCKKINYWYGEGEIIDYAYDNSKLLKSSNGRYKITWRYIISNINKMLELHDWIDNLFFRNIPEFSAINTAFFKTNNEDYKEFYNLKKVLLDSWDKWRALKYIYYEKILSMNSLNIWKLKDLPCRFNIQTKNKKSNFLKRDIFRYEKIAFTLWLFSVNKTVEKHIFKFRFPNRRDFVN